MKHRLDVKAEQKFSLKRTDERVGWISEEDRFGHAELECTVRHLGIEVDDALEIDGQTGV